MRQFTREALELAVPRHTNFIGADQATSAGRRRAYMTDASKVIDAAKMKADAPPPRFQASAAKTAPSTPPMPELKP